MDSPIHIGDSTTNSIKEHLSYTHLETQFHSQIHAATYGGEKFIQLTLKLSQLEAIHILRRVQDSYVNINQMLLVLVELKALNNDQVTKFIQNEILENIQYKNIDGYTPEVLDIKDSNKMLNGIWITFDKAIYLSNKFNIYNIVKKLFLVNVHDFDELPKFEIKLDIKVSESSDQSGKRKSDDDTKESEPDIFQETKQYQTSNPNYPFTLPVTSTQDKDNEIINVIKLSFTEIFKSPDLNSLTFDDIKQKFSKYSRQITDIALDQDGKTALHFASTLAADNLVSTLIKLGLNSPIRGDNNGESPLICSILVTNSMEKGNFNNMLKWLYPGIWLLNSSNWSILHYLGNVANSNQRKLESSQYYLNKILRFILNDPSQGLLSKLVNNLVNLQDDKGNTALHLASENNNRWMIDVLIELKADLNLANKLGIKPLDYEIVKEILNLKKLNQITYDDENLYLIKLLQTNLQFLNKKIEVGHNSILNDDFPIKKFKPQQEDTKDDNSTGKLFTSIRNLLDDTRKEYESILNNKHEQIQLLNQQLFDTTLLTTNNKFLNKKIHEKLVQLDNLKLQMSNITEKLEALKNVLPQETPSDKFENKLRFDADEPFRIDVIYNKLLQDPEGDLNDIKSQVMDDLPDPILLRARINGYKQLNETIEAELNNLNDYNNLTNKFKKVVSFCTGVDINEVDELLDGLLEAVESQQ